MGYTDEPEVNGGGKIQSSSKEREQVFVNFSTTISPLEQDTYYKEL